MNEETIEYKAFMKMNEFTRFFRFDNVRFVFYADQSGHVEFDFYHDNLGAITICRFDNLNQFLMIDPFLVYKEFQHLM